MKKILSMLLALVMVFSMATVALAATDYSANIDVKPVITVNYKVNNGGTAPAETFTFSFAGVSVKDNEGNAVANPTYPEIADVSVTFDASNADQTRTQDVTINANSYNLGVYTYKVTQAKGTKAGVSYTTDDLYLVLTILRDETSGNHFVAAMHFQSATGNKETGVTNTYDCGSLNVTKKIAGNNANMDEKFKFTVKFSSTDSTFEPGSVIVTDATWNSEEKAFQKELTNNDMLSFSNIPAGVTYTVEEDAMDYTSDGGVWQTTDDKKIDANETEKVTFTNTRNYNDIDTGVITESAPYILLIAVCAVAAVMFVVKRRRVEF